MWDSESSKVLLWNQVFWALESGVQLKESGIPLTIGIRNPSSTHSKSGIQYSESWKFGLWNVEYWALESGIQLKESGIPLTIGIRNPSSNDKESGIHGVEPELRDCLGFPSYWSTLSRAKVAKNTFLLEDTTLHFSPPQRLPLGNPLKMTIIEKVASASWSARFLFFCIPTLATKQRGFRGGERCFKGADVNH